MDELDRFGAFRSGVAGPSEDARRRASALLATAVDSGQSARAPAARLITTRRGYGALALAAIVGATATALLVTTPWSNSRGFLAKAEAALTPPAGTVLHMKWETTSTWTRRFCTVIRGQGEVWIDGASPHTYRVLLNDLPDPADPRALGCSSGTASEYGGTYRSKETLRFVPPNRLSVAQRRFLFQLDPAGSLREAISAGTAHDEGRTQLDGRTVERIRIDPPSACPSERGYAYVDPETFYPVEIVATRYQVEIVGGPGSSSYSRLGVRDVMRFQAFEYLPRTAANLALTDIRAQHPDAIGP